MELSILQEDLFQYSFQTCQFMEIWKGYGRSCVDLVQNDSETVLQSAHVVGW